MTRLLAALFALALASCNDAARTAGPPSTAVPVRAAVVEQRDLDEALVLTGTLRPRAQVGVVAEVPARLLRVAKQEGARVAQGEVLAVLDETDYRLAHDRAAAALAVAEANRAHAVAERDRADNLLKTGGITDKEHLAARVGLQVAEAALAQARAETAIAAQQRDRTEVRAPFGGRVARRLVDPGTMLAAGTPLFTLVDDTVLEFRASVPSSDWSRVRAGAAAEVTTDALASRAFAGRVARVSPLVDERTRSFEVVVEVPGRAELVGGLFAKATVRARRIEGALVVPPAALVRGAASAQEAEAFVVVDGKARRRAVGIGMETSDAVQVTRGLEAGAQVVLDPPAALGDGSPVEVREPRR